MSSTQSSTGQSPLFTLLIAVYNTADYLPQCLDSVLAQTERRLQVVCVDDASTDDSLTVLQRYAARDDRFEVIHLDRNQGQAHARNVGLQHARGRYVGFLDSDDWLSPDCLELSRQVFDAHPQTGAVLLHLQLVYPDHAESYPMPSFEVLTGRRAFALSLDWRIHGVYVVRADIHRRYPYDESCHAFSDDNTTRLHYLASEEVRTCEGVYYYRQRSTSVSHAVNLRRFDYLGANLSMKRQLEELGVGDDLLNLYENHRWLNLVGMYMFYHHHRHEMSLGDAAEALHLIRKTWTTIEPRRLKMRYKIKFGYIPFRGCWALFRLEEEAYFRLRWALKRR
jgi:glycosyltransferase involved in cell wall biosynthesis